MTSLDKIERGPVGAATSGNHLAQELTETLRLAVPMALTQLGQIAMMTTDLALIGRLPRRRWRIRCSSSASPSEWA
jgi:MATE family, multidrug efflux pump